MSAERSLGAEEPTEVDLSSVPRDQTLSADSTRPALLSTGPTLSVAGPDLAADASAHHLAVYHVTADPDTADHDTADPGTADNNNTPLHSTTAYASTAENRADGDAWLLVRRTQDGDAEAFGLLYDRYVDMIYRFVYYRLGDRTEAEDLTSETFMRALRRISTVHEQGRDVGAWLTTIARNLVLDHVKSAQYRLSIPTGEIFELPNDVHHDRNWETHRDTHGDYYNADTTEGGALAALDQRALLEAVSRLSPEQQESIVLRFFQGLSLAETAEVMGRNAGAVKALQHRAMRRLQVLLTEPAPARQPAPEVEDPRRGEVHRLPGRSPPPSSHRVTRARKRYRPRPDG